MDRLNQSSLQFVCVCVCAKIFITIYIYVSNHILFLLMNINAVMIKISKLIPFICTTNWSKIYVLRKENEMLQIFVIQLLKSR